MTATLPSWMTETGPLPILERPRIPAGDSRGRGGQFAAYAELPAPRPRRAIIRPLFPDVPAGVVSACCPDCVYGDQP